MQGGGERRTQSRVRSPSSRERRDDPEARFRRGRHVVLRLDGGSRLPSLLDVWLRLLNVLVANVRDLAIARRSSVGIHVED